MTNKLLFLTVCLLLGGCNSITLSNDSESKSSDTNAPSNEVTSTKTEEEEKKNPFEKEQEIDIEDVTVFDNDEYMLKITGIQQTYSHYYIQYEAENRSAENSYTIYCGDLAVNGVKADAIGFIDDLNPGTSTTGKGEITDEDLVINGINDFNDIRLTYSVLHEENYEKKEIDRITVHINPYGEENATIHSREDKPSDTILVDTENVKAVFTGTTETKNGDLLVDLYIENNSADDLWFYSENAYLNEIYTYKSFANVLCSGERGFEHIRFPYYDLEDLNLTPDNVSKIDFVLAADKVQYDTDRDEWSVIQGLVVNKNVSLLVR